MDSIKFPKLRVTDRSCQLKHILVCFVFWQFAISWDLHAQPGLCIKKNLPCLGWSLANFGGGSLRRLQVAFDSRAKCGRCRQRHLLRLRLLLRWLLHVKGCRPAREHTHHSAPWHAIVLRTGIDGWTGKDQFNHLAHFPPSSNKKLRINNSFACRNLEESFNDYYSIRNKDLFDGKN